MHDNDEARGFAGLALLASTLSDVDETVDSTSQLPYSEPVPTTSGTNSSNVATQKTLDSRRLSGQSRSGRNLWLNRFRIFAALLAIMIVAWATIDAIRDKGKSPILETPPMSRSTNPGQIPTKTSSEPRPAATQSRPQPSSRVKLASQIESDKAQALKMEGQISEMDDRLDKLLRSMKSYEDLEMIDEYNALVPIYNSVLDQRIELYGKYDRLINEINAKVKRYNSGDR